MMTNPIERKRTKTETITLRIDPKTKFMIEFLARLDGQSLTAVVDTAIRDRADSRGIDVGYDEREGTQIVGKWSGYWDPSEGVRTLKLLAEPAYKSTFEEDEIRQFTLSHWQFFYLGRDGSSPRRGYIDIVWPELENILQIWRESKSKDYWAAGNEMKNLLRRAGVAPPDWPPKGEMPSRAPVVDDLDDDIPF